MTFKIALFGKNLCLKYTPARGIGLLGFAIAAAFGPPAFAVPDLFCSNSDYDWTLDLASKDAQFEIRAKKTDFEVVHSTTAQPGPYPIGLTLISENDTAIVLVRQTENYSVDIMTQDRGLPIILSGDCVRQ